MGQSSRLTALSILILATLAHAQQKGVVQGVSRALIPHVVTFFIERCDQRAVCMPEKVLHSVNKAAALDRTLIEQAIRRRSVQGIFATYMGSVDTSDASGQISFLRRQLGDEVIFVVTRSLQPILSGPTTVHHFIVSKDAPVAYYRMVRDTALSKWAVRKIKTPEDRVVPLTAIVLIAEPDQVVLPDESFITTKSPNLLLPTVYALKTLTPGINALHFLAVNRFFAPNIYARRYAQTRYGTIIVP